MGRIIGIDLGTSNCVVAIHEGKETTIIANAQGLRVTPSVVAYTREGRLVGLVTAGSGLSTEVSVVSPSWLEGT